MLLLSRLLKIKDVSLVSRIQHLVSLAKLYETLKHINEKPRLPQHLKPPRSPCDHKRAQRLRCQRLPVHRIILGRGSSPDVGHVTDVLALEVSRVVVGG